MICACCYAACPRNFTERINLTTKLQSEILLPCYFDSAFIKLNQNQETSVVWSHFNTTIIYIVDIKVNGDPAFWDSRKGRIKALSYISGSGNFSILIHNVQVSDLGLYRCELFKESNCSLLYKEMSLTSPINNWLLIIGGGGFLLLCLITACGCYTWTKRPTVPSAHNCPANDAVGKTDEITYASVVHKPRHDSNALVVDMDKNSSTTSASDHLNSETVLYARVNERGGKR
ncbi:hypothetical protein IRJ41_004021 [Triplophysa rosa]|uniref:Ig-like domain-containing protein n=1 Tax=Triplophysa rosa TaxID=992332 RepID=A0A9W7W7G8_TRIRA|nr:hypothetical protein IRJ41_004021 [Triplophysa rosa]